MRFTLLLSFRECNRWEPAPNPKPMSNIESMSWKFMHQSCDCISLGVNSFMQYIVHISLSVCVIARALTFSINFAYLKSAFFHTFFGGTFFDMSRWRFVNKRKIFSNFPTNKHAFSWFNVHFNFFVLPTQFDFHKNWCTKTRFSIWNIVSLPKVLCALVFACELWVVSLMALLSLVCIYQYFCLLVDAAHQIQFTLIYKYDDGIVWLWNLLIK